MKRNLQVDFDDSVEVTEFNGGTGYTFTIPSSPNFRGSRYVVFLPEIPYLFDPTKLPTISGMNRVENILPATGEFRTCDVDFSDVRIAPHMVEFNSAQAGLTKTINFWSYGSIIDNEDIMKSTLTITQSNSFTQLKAIYNNAGTWALAKADASATIGIAIVDIATSTKFDAVFYGKIYSPAHGLGTAGSTLFVSAATAGLLTTTQPANYVNPLAIILDADNIFVVPSPYKAVDIARHVPINVDHGGNGAIWVT